MSDLPPNITKLNNFGHIWYKQLCLVHHCLATQHILPSHYFQPWDLDPTGVIIYNTTLERSTEPVNVYQASHK